MCIFRRYQILERLFGFAQKWPEQILDRRETFHRKRDCKMLQINEGITDKEKV